VPSLRLIGEGTPVVAPRGLGPLLRRLRLTPLELETGDEVELRGIRVRAVPAHHAGTRYPMGTPSAALGYVISGGLTAYFAGDTGLYDGMRDLGPLDVAVLPVGGWGPRLPSDHLNPLSAAKALRLLEPRACVPIHWGTLYPPWLPPAFNSRWGDWPRAFERYAAHLAPEVEVRVLPPGGATTFVRDARSVAGLVSSGRVAAPTGDRLAGASP
jgi:L-ascorbate metabolism protein UlaG (beta-lactamase superfamily)